MLSVYHFFQFPALFPATSMIARDWEVEGEQNSHVRALASGSGTQLLHVRVLRSFEGVHEWSSGDRSVFLELFEGSDQMVVFLFVEGVRPCFDEGHIDLPLPHRAQTISNN